MAIDNIKEVNRAPGLQVATGTDVISGQPVRLYDPQTLIVYDGNGEVFGLAGDDTLVFVQSEIPTFEDQTSTVRVLSDQPSGDLTKQSIFYTEVDRGNLVTVYIDGGVFGLWNDGRGSPFVTTDTYTLNSKLYANPQGLVTAQSTGTSGSNPMVGVCLGTPNTDPEGRLVMQLRVVS